MHAEHQTKVTPKALGLWRKRLMALLIPRLLSRVNEATFRTRIANE